MVESSGVLRMEGGDILIAEDEAEGCREGLFLLPMEDGSTAIVYEEMRQAKLVTCPLDPSDSLLGEDGALPDIHPKRILQYVQAFPREYQLKVSLFKEMVRSSPPWTEIKDYEWMRYLLQMSTNGALPDPSTDLSGCEEILLKWLLFTVNDPKITIIPKVSIAEFIAAEELLDSGVEKCMETLLETVSGGDNDPWPSLAFLLERRRRGQGRGGESCWPQGGATSLTGFLAASPGQLFSLLYLFPEAGRGQRFTSSPSAALKAATTTSQTFSLAGETSLRYRALLMIEYLVHPGINCLSATELRPGGEPVQSSALYKISDTTNVRPLALLLYRVPTAVTPSSSSAGSWPQTKLKLNGLIMFGLIALCIIGQTIISARTTG